MKLEITVYVDQDDITGAQKISIGLPKEQKNMSTKDATHLLTSGVALLIKTCSKMNTGIQDHELMKEVYQHLEAEFSSITSRDDTYVNKEYFDKIEEKIYEKNFTLVKNLKEGDLFLSKANNESLYLKKIDNDKHLVQYTKMNGKEIKNGTEYEIPHGNFPVFKKIKK